MRLHPGRGSLKVMMVLVAALCAVAAGTAVAAEKGVPATLRVGTDATYPPFEMVEGEQFTGFDVDLIREVGKRIGSKVEIQNVAWDGLIPGLINGNYDVIISAMTILDERAAVVDFSDPYFTAGQVIVVRRGDQRIQSPTDLKGRVVAVQINTTGQFVSEKVEGVARIDKFDTTPLAVQAVIQKSADAAVIDLPVALEFQREHPDSVQVVGRPFTVEYYGIALKKGRQDLLRALNRALAQIKADGTYDAIYERWIGGQAK